MKKLLIIFGLVLFVTKLAFGQAVFAPIKNAEWRYYYETDFYGFWKPEYPIPRPQKGVLSILYTKDTTINSWNLKKFETTDRYVFQNSDTTNLGTRQAFFMMQRNDSVFLLNNDTLALAFVYKTTLGSVIEIQPKYRSIKFLLSPRWISDTTFINSQNTKLKKTEYNVKIIPSVVDLSYSNPLIILDRIGIVNADITYITSQPMLSQAPGRHFLLCYTDNEIGQIKLTNGNCDLTTSIKDFNNNLESNFIVLQSGDFLNIKNVEWHIDQNIIIYDLYGRVLKFMDFNNPSDEVQFNKKELPRGLLFIVLSSKGKVLSSKKVFNF